MSRIYAFIETEYFLLFLNKIKRILKLAKGKIIAENGNNVSFLSLILNSVMYITTRGKLESKRVERMCCANHRNEGGLHAYLENHHSKYWFFLDLNTNQLHW